MADVATRKLLENEKVIIWELVLEPGESTGVHTHSNDYLIYTIEGSTIEATDKDGNLLGQPEVPAGTVLYLNLEGDELVADDTRYPATHDSENIGASRYREILVEIK